MKIYGMIMAVISLSIAMREVRAENYFVCLVDGLVQERIFETGEYLIALEGVTAEDSELRDDGACTEFQHSIGREIAVGLYDVSETLPIGESVTLRYSYDARWGEPAIEWQSQIAYEEQQALPPI